MRQYAGFSSAEATNERFKLLLERGQMGLSVAFDLPTQLGLDADDELSFGEVGKVGVSISSVEDMKLLFDGIFGRRQHVNDHQRPGHGAPCDVHRSSRRARCFNE